MFTCYKSMCDLNTALLTYFTLMSCTIPSLIVLQEISLGCLYLELEFELFSLLFFMLDCCLAAKGDWISGGGKFSCCLVL